MINKKEIIKNYKNQKQPAGIFAVKNLLDNKIFIGTSLNLLAKLRGISFELELGSHAFKNLADDYKKLGKENFEISILDELQVKDETDGELRTELDMLESMWVDKLKNEGVGFYNKK